MKSGEKRGKGQTRILECAAPQVSQRLGFSSRVHACVLSRFSRVRLCVTPWTAARQAPLCIGFSRLEYWSGLPCPPPGHLPDPGIETRVSEVSCIGRQLLYHCAAQSCGRLGPDNALLWGQPLWCRVLSSVPDLHPVDVSRAPFPLLKTKDVFRHSPGEEKSQAYLRNLHWCLSINSGMVQSFCYK